MNDMALVAGRRTEVGPLGKIASGLKASIITCLDCRHFDRTEKEILNPRGEMAKAMRGCTRYNLCRNYHHGGPKSLWRLRLK